MMCNLAILQPILQGGVAELLPEGGVPCPPPRPLATP